MSRSPRRFYLVCAAAVVLAAAGIALYVAYQADRRLLAQVAQRVAADPTLTDEQRLELDVKYVAHQLHDPTFEEISPWPVRLYYLLNPLHPGPGDILRWGSDYRGNCGSHSRVLVAMLQSQGVDAQQLHLLDPQGRSIHTVVQARINGRLAVADGAFDIIYRRRDGSLATAADLAADTMLFHAQTTNVAGYPRQYVYLSTTVLNWQKVPVVLPAIRAALKLVLGGERVSQIRRPGIWMWPQAFYSLLSLILAGTFAVIAWRLRPAGGRQRATAKARAAG